MRLGEANPELFDNHENFSLWEKIKFKFKDLRETIERNSSADSRKMLLALAIGLGALLADHAPAYTEQLQTDISPDLETEKELSEEQIQQLIETINTTEDESEFRQAFNQYPESLELWPKLNNKNSRLMMVKCVLEIDQTDFLPYLKKGKKDLAITNDVKIAKAIEEKNDLAIRFHEILLKENKTEADIQELETLVEKMPDQWFCLNTNTENEFVCRHFARKVSYEHRDQPPSFDPENKIYQIHQVPPKQRLPIFEARQDLPNSETAPDHVICGVLIGDNVTDANDWLLFEPQTDSVEGSDGISDEEMGSIFSIMPFSDQPLDNLCDQGNWHYPQATFFINVEQKLINLPQDFTEFGLAEKIRSDTNEEYYIHDLWNLSPSEENLALIIELAKISNRDAYEITQKAEKIFRIKKNPEFDNLSSEAQFFVKGFFLHKDLLVKGRELDLFFFIAPIKKHFNDYIEGCRFLLTNAKKLEVTKESDLSALSVMISKMKNFPDEVVKKGKDKLKIF